MGLIVGHRVDFVGTGFSTGIDEGLKKGWADGALVGAIVGPLSTNLDGDSVSCWTGSIGNIRTVSSGVLVAKLASVEVLFTIKMAARHIAAVTHATTRHATAQIRI